MNVTEGSLLRKGLVMKQGFSSYYAAYVIHTRGSIRPTPIPSPYCVAVAAYLIAGGIHRSIVAALLAKRIDFCVLQSAMVAATTMQ